MEDVEGLIISPEDDAVTEDVETVEREGLPADQTVGLHPVLDGLVAQPGRDVTERVPGEAGTVPVTEVARLAARVNTVRVEVTMVRSEGQKESLERVEDKISDLVAKVQSGDEVQSALAECKALLAACSEGEIVGGGANQKFEQLVLGCSARDQKEVKGRLENLLEQISALASFKN